jgi:hypothetical protein
LELSPVIQRCQLRESPWVASPTVLLIAYVPGPGTSWALPEMSGRFIVPNPKLGDFWRSFSAELT